MGDFNIKQAKEINATKDAELYKVYSSKSNKLYVVLGIGANVKEKTRMVIFQELNQGKEIKLMDLTEFLKIMTPIKNLKYD